MSGTWTVPKVTASSTSSRTTAYSSVWVGIDGYSSKTVEQLGTDSDIQNGQPRYYAWYEIYPNYSITIPGMTIQPGDSITASVQYVASGAQAGQFMLTITDSSRPNDSFTTYQGMPSGSAAPRSSAEWIVEAPSVGGQSGLAAQFRLRGVHQLHGHDQRRDRPDRQRGLGRPCDQHGQGLGAAGHDLGADGCQRGVEFYGDLPVRCAVAAAASSLAGNGQRLSQPMMLSPAGQAAGVSALSADAALRDRLFAAWNWFVA